MSFTVDIEAARALGKWKLYFANEVAEGAKRLALEECSRQVTVEHYRQAALEVLRSMEGVVEQESYELGWEEAV
jgi:hypothetical protein